jgi:phosphohistidine phosphatase
MTMKRLILLRHAKAVSGGAALQDFDRPLASEGLQDAEALGSFIRAQSYTIDHVICSPALRTKQTLDALALSQDLPVKYVEPLYEAMAGQILEMTHETEQDAQHLIVIGHNPGLHELAIRLCTEDSPLSLLKRLMSSYRPGAMSVFDCPIESWSDLELGRNSLTNFQEPIDYNAPSRPTRWM